MSANKENRHQKQHRSEVKSTNTLQEIRMDNFAVQSVDLDKKDTSEYFSCHSKPSLSHMRNNSSILLIKDCDTQPEPQQLYTTLYNKVRKHLETMKPKKPTLTKFLSQPIDQRSKQWQQSTQRSINLKRKALEQQELDGCTFKPKITKKINYAMYLKPANHNHLADQQHLLRQYTSARLKLDALEREIKRPGSGQLWTGTLTSPQGPTLRSHSRSLIKSQQKQRRNMIQSSTQQKKPLLSPFAHTTIINFNITNIKSSAEQPVRKLDTERLSSLQQTKRRCQCAGNHVKKRDRSEAKSVCELTQHILDGKGSTVLWSPKESTHASTITQKYKLFQSTDPQSSHEQVDEAYFRSIVKQQISTIL